MRRAHIDTMKLQHQKDKMMKNGKEQLLVDMVKNYILRIRIKLLAILVDNKFLSSFKKFIAFLNVSIL